MIISSIGKNQQRHVWRYVQTKKEEREKGRPPSAPCRPFGEGKRGKKFHSVVNALVSSEREGREGTVCQNTKLGLRALSILLWTDCKGRGGGHVFRENVTISSPRFPHNSEVILLRTGAKGRGGKKGEEKNPFSEITFPL